jgi:hypothetical protein
MGSAASISVVIPLISALFGGVVVAILNYVLNRPVTKASLAKMVAETEKIRTETEIIRSKVSDAQEKVNTIVKYSLAFYLFDHLSHLYYDNEYVYHKNPNFERDLRFLRDHGYLEQFHIGPIQDGENLIGKACLTPLGKLLVELREQGGKPKAESTA